ncbi:MAG: O-antigen ligase family protein [Deferribacteraceae bacterium]|jgi:O-antigen ligase|nr:O-antigen ligase family protein [Deferribacteraceae bacterium]
MPLEFFMRLIALAGPLSVSVTQIAYGGVIVLFIYGFKKGRIPVNERNPNSVFFLILIIALLVTTVCAEDVKRSFGQYKQVLLPLTFLVGYYMYKRPRLDGVFFWTLTGGAIATVWGIIRGFLYGSPDGNYAILRVAGTFRSSIRFGNLIALVTALGICALLLRFYRSKRERNIYIAMTLLSFAGLIASGTRGAMIALMAGIVALLICVFRARGILLSALVCAVAVLLVYIIPDLRTRFAESLSFARWGDHTTSLGWRFVLWEESWRVFRENPLTGVGFGNLAEYYLKPLKTLHEDGMSVAHAHNNFLQILAEHGILGFAAVSLLYIKLAFDQLKGIIAKNRFAIAGFVLLTVSVSEGITEYSLFNSELCMMFWLLCGGLMAAQNSAQNYKQGKDGFAS